MKKTAIIGAGLAGLSAAGRLQAAGRSVTILEKSRSLGGRCASRLWQGHVVDHGAQYFTMRNEAFRDEITRLCEGAIRPIEAPVQTENGDILPSEAERFYHARGNNHLGRTLAVGLEIRKEQTIETIVQHGRNWHVAGEEYDEVLVTAPWPQAQRLLFGAPTDEIDPGVFVPNLTALFSYAMPWEEGSRAVYAKSWKNDDLAWSACENHKEGRVQPGTVVFVAQAGVDFSQKYLETEPAGWAELLRTLLERRWNLDPATFSGQMMHRWRYARALDQVPEPDLPPGLFVSGDAFAESRVESAWLAGDRIAARMLDE